MREEGETLAYRESAASFSCNVYRFFLEINVIDFDSLYLGSTQSTGGAEGKDAQVPAMNEKKRLYKMKEITVCGIQIESKPCDIEYNIDKGITVSRHS